ncbi:MAG: hypothetical protein MUE98_08465 [Rhodobacteraceae bacterium]|jgi:hypothetical protein|nr:hypothetical protein [Paracoccaceae bacterium]
MSEDIVITAVDLVLAGQDPPPERPQATGAALGPFRIETICDPAEPAGAQRSRHTPLSARLRASLDALASRAGLSAEALAGPATGIVSGSCYGTSLVHDGHRQLRAAGPRGLDAVGFAQATHNYPVSACAIELGLKGPCAAVAGSRLAGMQALLCAFDWLRERRCDRVLVAAYEDIRGAVADHVAVSRPDAGVVREAMVTLCLETAAAAQARGIVPLARLRSMTVLPPAAGQSEAVEEFLGASGLVDLARALSLRVPAGAEVVAIAHDDERGGVIAKLSPWSAQGEIAA